MSKTWKVILSVSLVINLVLGYLLYSKSDPVSSNSDEFVSKIDSLEFELTTLQEHRNKIREEIDTVSTQLRNVNKEYEKTHSRIIVNSPSEDYSFFVEYLRRNAARLDSINNF